MDPAQGVQRQEDEGGGGQAEEAEKGGVAGGKEGRTEGGPVGVGGTEASDPHAEAFRGNAEEPGSPGEGEDEVEEGENFGAKDTEGGTGGHTQGNAVFAGGVGR